MPSILCYRCTCTRIYRTDRSLTSRKGPGQPFRLDKDFVFCISAGVWERDKLQVILNIHFTADRLSQTITNSLVRINKMRLLHCKRKEYDKISRLIHYQFKEELFILAFIPSITGLVTACS
jgi:hypothetical protein